MAEAVAVCLCSQIIICACDNSLDQDGHVYVCMKLKVKTLEIWLMAGNKNLLITDHAKHCRAWCKLGYVKERNLNKRVKISEWEGVYSVLQLSPAVLGLSLLHLHHPQYLFLFQCPVCLDCSALFCSFVYSCLGFFPQKKHGVKTYLWY